MSALIRTTAGYDEEQERPLPRWEHSSVAAPK
jgi:hypothetical protein